MHNDTDDATNTNGLHCLEAPFCACGRPVHARGLCQRHYTARYRGTVARPRCAVPGCPRPAYGTGVRCWSHAVLRLLPGP